MKTLFVLFSALAFGQVSSTLTLPPGPITPGQTATLNVSIGGTAPAAVQFIVTYDSTVFTVAPTWSIGPVATTANKILNCRVTAVGQLKCLVDGPTATTIATGIVANINLTLASTALPGTTPLALVNGFAADITGTVITVIMPAGANLIIAALPCDLDASGTITQADVTIGRNQVLGLATCGSANLDTDTFCTVIDVQRLQVAAAGGACRVGL